MPRKARPAAVSTFEQKLNEETRGELHRVAQLPGIRAKDIHDLLLSFGYNGSLRSVYTWWDRVRLKGEKAAEFNEKLKAFQGVDSSVALERLIVVLSDQLDIAIANTASLDLKGMKAGDVLRMVPELGRTILATSQVLNQMSSIKDRRDLETAGAARLAAELRSIFRDTPFQAALEEGIRAAMAIIEGD